MKPICLAKAVSTLAILLFSVGLLAEPQSPVKPVENRDVYHPGTEALGKDEMRVTACGTGMPNARPAQAAGENASRFARPDFTDSVGRRLSAKCDQLVDV